MAEARRVALVTGGAKRVGRAIVQMLADAQFDIAFTYLSSDAEAAELTRELGCRFAKSMAIRADLTKPESAVEAIHTAFAAQFDRLDVLVNNASLFLPGDLAATDSALISRLMAIHLHTPLLLVKQFASMLRSANGHVVNMLDLLAEKPWPAYLPYCASKAAMANATIALARELAPQVTVNGIAPGVIEWPDDMPADEREKYLTRVPLARAGTPTDAANLVKFLITDGAYMTGQILRLDGGRSIA